MFASLPAQARFLPVRFSAIAFITVSAGFAPAGFESACVGATGLAATPSPPVPGVDVLLAIGTALGAAGGPVVEQVIAAELSN